MKIAIMQPYWYPSASYFRLIAATDLFVVLDSVQWNRRGRVHRYQVGTEWTTLPIKKTNRDTTMIKDMQWQSGTSTDTKPIDYIISTLENMCQKLRIPFNYIRSSGIAIDESLKGQDRIIAICKKLGATEYVNLPGGRKLYNEDAFTKEGIRLTFLPDWNGSFDGIIERLKHEPANKIHKQIYEQI